MAGLLTLNDHVLILTGLRRLNSGPALCLAERLEMMGWGKPRGMTLRSSSAQLGRGRAPKRGTEDLTGMRAGHWTVLKFLRPGGSSPVWLCRCASCKSNVEVRGCQVRNTPPACHVCGATARGWEASLARD